MVQKDTPDSSINVCSESQSSLNSEHGEQTRKSLSPKSDGIRTPTPKMSLSPTAALLSPKKSLRPESSQTLTPNCEISPNFKSRTIRFSLSPNHKGSFSPKTSLNPKARQSLSPNGNLKSKTRFRLRSLSRLRGSSQSRQSRVSCIPDEADFEGEVRVFS